MKTELWGRIGIHDGTDSKPRGAWRGLGGLRPGDGGGHRPVTPNQTFMVTQLLVIQLVHKLSRRQDDMELAVRAVSAGRLHLAFPVLGRLLRLW